MTIEEIEKIIHTLETVSSDNEEYWDISAKLDSEYYSMIKLLLSEIKRLQEGIAEVLDGSLPYLSEKRLKELLLK